MFFRLNEFFHDFIQFVFLTGECVPDSSLHMDDPMSSICPFCSALWSSYFMSLVLYFTFRALYSNTYFPWGCLCAIIREQTLFMTRVGTEEKVVR